MPLLPSPQLAFPGQIVDDRADGLFEERAGAVEAEDGADLLDALRPGEAEPVPSTARVPSRGGPSRNWRSGSGEPLLRRDPEGADDPHTIQVLAVLEILGQEIRTLGRPCRRDDESIPPGEPEAVLNAPGSHEDPLIDGDRPPCPKSPDDLPGRLGIQPGLELTGDGDVEFLENLKAGPPRLGVPKVIQPASGLGLLVRLPLVELVDEDVCVNEDSSGHGSLHERVGGRCWPGEAGAQRRRIAVAPPGRSSQIAYG